MQGERDETIIEVGEGLKSYEQFLKIVAILLNSTIPVLLLIMHGGI